MKRFAQAALTPEVIKGKVQAAVVGLDFPFLNRVSTRCLLERYAAHPEVIMASVGDSFHQEAVVLNRAVENLCRKLIRFLVGRMSLVNLQEIVRYVFVEEIENKLRSENPNKNIHLTQLALLSGLDTRTLTKIRNSPKYRRPFYEEANFLREFTPGAAILDVWSSKPPYFNEVTGKPRRLAVSGNSLSFESLFAECGKMRGVTYMSLLERLVESRAVELDAEQDMVRLVLKSYLPSDSKDKLGAIEMGFSALGNMVDTVTKNIVALENGNERLYQRGAWTYRLSPSKKHELRLALRSLMESTDREAREMIESHEDSFKTSDQITAGISLFYFEESSN